MSPGHKRRAYALAVGVLVLSLAITGLLTFVSYRQFDNNEKRLLDLRAKEIGAVLSAALPNIQTPLASSAALADATDGNVQKFVHFARLYAGPPPNHQFVSISLWRLGTAQRGPVAVVGSKPLIASLPAVRARFFDRATHTSQLSVMGLQPPALMRLGYAATTPSTSSRYVAYGESLLPANRRSRYEKNTAFSDLNYVFYLGPKEDASNLLVTSVSKLPLHGRSITRRIPFGDTVLTTVVTPRQPLGGSLPQRLPLIIAIVGALLAIAAAILTARLISRRLRAEQLAMRLEQAVEENRRLYAEQRTIAQTLQHALLPEQLPRLARLETSARYEPGEQGMEVGGDWYDIIPIDDQRLLAVVGDVSGRGLRAATTMASLRFAIHAYAAQADPPETILSKLSKILSVKSGGQIATAMCALIDVREGQVTLASAGHLPPLMLSNGTGRYLDSRVGVPIGVRDDARYEQTTLSLPGEGTLLAFTDGLVERRGESLDLGLDRLRQAATANHAGLDELLHRLVDELRAGAAEDDTAIVGIRWSQS